MPDQPTIEIFAEGAQAVYLAETVRLAGFGQGGENAVLALAAGKAPPAKEGRKTVILGEGKDSPGVRVIKTPIRAAALIEILQKEMGAASSSPAIVTIGDCSLDTRENLWLVPDESPLRLTEKETAILLCLKQSAPSKVSRQELLDGVWAYAEGVETHTLETHIYRLRQKIEQDPSNPAILLTAEDGYRLNG